MTNQLATNGDSGVIESLVLNGDLSHMTPGQKVYYYRQFCASLRLNPLTQPFKILKLQGKEQLYATKDATDQLRSRDEISVVEMKGEMIPGATPIDDLWMVTTKVENKEGRTDIAIGVVPIGTLKGEARANAMMKCETKSKRRATLSLCGLGISDESEIDSIPGATIIEMPVVADPEPTKTLLTDKAFAQALDRITKGGELALIGKLRENCKLTQAQIDTLLSIEDQNTVPHE